MTKLLIFDAFTLLICKKNVVNYALLRCKTFSLKIWLCKVLGKYHVCIMVILKTLASYDNYHGNAQRPQQGSGWVPSKQMWLRDAQRPRIGNSRLGTWGRLSRSSSIKYDLTLFGYMWSYLSFGFARSRAWFRDGFSSLSMARRRFSNVFEAPPSSGLCRL